MEKRCVLIIDDDPVLRKSLADILRLKGYDTLQAGDGAEGITLVEGHAVNVALLDLGLPDIPGMKVLERIKLERTSTEAIILTGNASLESALEATSQGAFSYLTKPYDIDQLLLLIRRAVEKQEAEQKIVRHIFELQRVNSELRALYEVSKATSRTLDARELAAEVLSALVQAELFPFRVFGSIYLLGDGGIHLMSFDNPAMDAVAPCREIRPGVCLCGRAAETGEIIVSPNALEGGHLAECLQDSLPHGRIVIPLKTLDRVVGILTLFTPAGTEVDEGSLKLFSVISSQIGIAVNNTRLYEEVRNNSLRDHLTGLLNRRFLEVQLEKCFETARRYGEELSAIMLDIDHFKDFNDRLGHVEGDRLLACISGMLIREMRSSDYVFRYGGEEFLILLPRSGPEASIEAARRVRLSVEQETEVTVSLGVAIYREGMTDGECLVRCADEALYRAKKEGRNRVVVAE